MVAAMFVTFVAGCAPTSKTGSGKFEVFSWWTGGGEADGLKAMTNIYNQKFPDVEFINATIAGGAGSNAKEVLKTRILGGDPPDAFQVHAGQEIAGWVKSGKLETLDDLYKEQNWDKVFPKDLLDILKVNGHYYSVPVNIHRANVIWYNKKVFADNKINVPKTWDEFLAAAEILKGKGITALALGDNGDTWTDVQIFECILLSTLGSDGYKGLWNGKTAWTDAKVTESLEILKKVLGYVNSDHSALSWDQAAQYVIDGKAAMTLMGDWADGYFISKKFADYGWAPSPGTEGTFMMLSDTFALPKGAKDRGNAIEWLKVCGSLDGQEAFNPLKGSIPARTDGGKGKDDEYLKSAMKDWSGNNLAPSLAHGAAAQEGWLTDIKTAMGTFVTKQDVAAMEKALIEAKTNAE
jgi:glucose/mannose transport system substrate-binding protein